MITKETETQIGSNGEPETVLFLYYNGKCFYKRKWQSNPCGCKSYIYDKYGPTIQRGDRLKGGYEFV